MHPHTYPFLFENGDFYLQFGLPSTRIQWEQSPKTHLFKNTLQSRVFENAGFSFTWTDKNGGFQICWCHTSYTSSMMHAPKGMLLYFHRFSFFVWTGENDLNMLRVDVYLLKREDILMHVDRAIIDVLIIARYSKILYPKIPLFFHNTNSPCLP